MQLTVGRTASMLSSVLPRCWWASTSTSRPTRCWTTWCARPCGAIGDVEPSGLGRLKLADDLTVYMLERTDVTLCGVCPAGAART